MFNNEITENMPKMTYAHPSASEAVTSLSKDKILITPCNAGNNLYDIQLVGVL